MASLGTALHLCIARAGVVGAARTEDVERILTSWSVAHCVDKGAACAQVTSFQEWLVKRWPRCAVYVEVPVEADGPNGTRIRGRVDLLVDTPEGWVLLDHKSSPGGAAKDDDLLADYGPQLLSYEHALLCATGKPVVQKWLYLPVAARAVRLS